MNTMKAGTKNSCKESNFYEILIFAKKKMLPLLGTIQTSVSNWTHRTMLVPVGLEYFT